MIALAPASGQAARLEISVEPLVVQFAVAPGGQASTRVTVKNSGTDAATVVANQIDWQTTVDGSVKTKKPGSNGSLSLNPFLRLSGNEFQLAPGETRLMTLSLVLPSTFSSAPGNYWGGYLIRAIPAGSPAATSFGVGANILVYETMGSPPRHLKLTALRVEDTGGGNIRLAARMLNDGGTFVRPSIHMQVAQAGRIVQSRDDSTPAIFAGAPRLYTRSLQGLAPGKYLLDLTIDYGGDTIVQGSTEFAVR